MGLYSKVQYTTNRYPLLTLSDGSATNVPVKISISKKDVINLCGDVEGITLTMVETGQNLDNKNVSYQIDLGS